MKQQAESHSEIFYNSGVEMIVRHTKNYFHKGLTKNEVFDLGLVGRNQIQKVRNLRG